MQTKFDATLDVGIFTLDSEEAKEYLFAFKGSTNILFDNDWVPLDVGTDKIKMEAFLSGKIEKEP